MSLTNLMMLIPKCPEHQINLEGKEFVIKTSDNNNYAHSTLCYCPKCKGYRLRKGDVEKDEKKIALEIIRTWRKSYEISDIVELKVR